jgi:hypothetical protein
MKSRLPIAVWVLVGILAIAAASLSLGQSESTATPSASSYGPSGSLAFADLLRVQGHNVEVTTDANPTVSPNDVLVAFDVFSERVGPFEKQLKHLLQQHIIGGGRVVVLQLRQNFQAATKVAETRVQDAQDYAMGQPLKVNSDNEVKAYDGSLLGQILDSLHNRVVVNKPDGPFAERYTMGTGSVLIVRDGIDATNRFLDKNDNAAVLLRALATEVKPHSHIVFLDAAAGNGTTSGVLETLGRWALAGWRQAILLFVVIAYSLGKSFGYPDEERKQQRGSRDLVDAVAYTYQRARASSVALRALLTDADLAIRRKLKLSREAPESEIRTLIPEPLAKALADVAVATQERVPNAYALEVSAKLDRELKEFLGEKRAPRRRSKLT